MCKVAGVTHITDKNRDDVWVFMQVLGDIMTPGNNDGLGYAAFDKSGKLFGERWLVNKTAFTDMSMVFKGLTADKMNKIYSFLGDTVKRHEAQAIILHTRAATCGKNIENTHPFVDNEDNPEVAIIHNGIIHNHDAFKKKYSTCDSEVLAHLYADNKVQETIKNLKEFTPDLGGWYTVLNLATANGKMVMDVYTDNGRLESYYIPALETRVYSSRGEDIKEAAQFLGLEVRQHMRTKSDTAFRVDVLTGDVVEFTKLPVWVPPPKSTKRGNEVLITEVGEVVTEHGNLDDDAFKARWLASTVSHNWRK